VVFEELFERDPAFAYHTLQQVAASVTNRLEQARLRLFLPPGQGFPEEGPR